MAEASVQRVNMVDSQVRPSDITDRRIIRAMLDVPRENFVPDAVKSLAYSDGDLDLGHGRQLMAPRTLAKLVQLAGVNAGDRVLVIGQAPGYAAEVLSAIGGEVTALCDSEQPSSHGGFTTVVGRLADGHVPAGPYDVILLDGAAVEIPGALRRQLKDGGRLVAILNAGKTGQAVVINRSNGVYGESAVFDASAKTLPGFERSAAFTL